MSSMLVSLVVAGMGWLGSAYSAQSQEEALPDETAPTQAPEEAQVQEAFELDLPSYDRNRDPFWPVDYVPEDTSGTQQTAQVASIPSDGGKETKSDVNHKELLKEKLAVQGIMKIGDQLVAMINEQPVAEGEMVTVLVAGVTYRYLVRTLTEDNVVLEPVAGDVKPGS